MVLAWNRKYFLRLLPGQSKRASQARPLAVYQNAGATFAVYQVKNLYERRWLHPSLWPLVKQARAAYARYGRIALFDSYDDKAAIYLAKAIYQGQEEWLGLRFVPADGLPKATEDLLKCGRREPLGVQMRRRLFAGNKNFLKQVVTVSRIGGLPAAGSSKLKHAAVLFALINKHFFEEAAKARRQFHYLTGLFRPEIIVKSLTRRCAKETLPRFTAAHQILGSNQPADFTLRRELYLYRYPAYFFKMEELLKTLKKLIKQGRLTNLSWRYYLKTKNNFADFVKESAGQIQAWQNLWRLLTVKGRLRDSVITGEELRQIIDQETADGPELKIMPVPLWQKSINKFLNYARVKQQK